MRIIIAILLLLAASGARAAPTCGPFGCHVQAPAARHEATTVRAPARKKAWRPGAVLRRVFCRGCR